MQIYPIKDLERISKYDKFNAQEANLMEYLERCRESECIFWFRKNLSIHGGLFRSCGPPLDPDSGKLEDCPTFEEVLGGIIQRPLIIGRALLISTIVIHFVVLLLSLGIGDSFTAAS